MKLQLWDTLNGEPENLLGEVDVTDEDLSVARANPVMAEQLLNRLCEELL